MHLPGKPIFFGVIVVVFIFSAFISCKKSDSNTGGTTNPLAALNLPATPFNYAAPPLPFYFQTPAITGQDNTPAANPVSNWGATLGRVLFYDKSLSLNNTIACASCHKQELSFSDNNAFSIGFNGQLTGRHSMPLVNARFYQNGRFFWDQRANTLETQVLMPIQDQKEMGMTLTEVLTRVQSKPHYPTLFQNAFGDANITTDRISKSLAQFIRSMISYQSKFDVGRAQIPPGQNPVIPPYINYTPEENLGKQLFFNPNNACAACHGTETFVAPGDRNNGIENPSIDRGVGGITNIPQQVGNFKSTSLKNIELTAPYMHDGRFTTLEQVVEHYNSGIQPNPNLGPQLKNPDGSPKRLNLTVAEKAALVAFLKTLTDRSITTDVKFSTPFK
jgi:cytochrome c peroxidase